jgi:hypothetical protein
VYAGISVFSGPGIVVDPGAGKVTLSGLTVNSLGGDVGIDFKSGDALYIDHATVSGFPTAGVRAEPGAAAIVHVRDSTLRDNGTGALFAPLASSTGTLDASIERSRLERNAVGVRFGGKTTTATIRSTLVAGGGTGISLAPATAGAAVAVELRRSTVSGVHSNGIETAAAAGTSATIAVVSSEVAQSGTGLSIAAHATALATDATITRNGTGVTVSGGGTAVSVGDNRLVGNDTDGTFSSTIAKQ